MWYADAVYNPIFGMLLVSGDKLLHLAWALAVSCCNMSAVSLLDWGSKNRHSVLGKPFAIRSLPSRGRCEGGSGEG